MSGARCRIVFIGEIGDCWRPMAKGTLYYDAALFVRENLECGE
jgi:hypothetical protein